MSLSIPICLARKPLSESTVAKNVLRWGTGGLNIDGTRIENNGKTTARERNIAVQGGNFKAGKFETDGVLAGGHEGGRFPSNVILDEDAAQVLDGQTGPLPQRGNKNPTKRGGGMFGHSEFGGTTGLLDTSGSVAASRFFYVAKSSKSDRGEGNIHPTVKPIKLMEYLIKLVTPEGGIVLDPFMGSGSTGVAALRNGFQFRGIEREESYYYISQARLEKESANGSQD